MRPSITDFLNYTFTLPPLRQGIDFFEGESASLLCMDLLLNQRVGVERATAAALAIHYHFGKPIAGLEGKIIEVTKWPYAGIKIRAPGRHLCNLVSGHLQNRDPVKISLSQLPDSAVGALGSLERYYNRSNLFFAPLRRIELAPETIRAITIDKFREITELNFPQKNLPKQLSAVATLLEMKKVPSRPSRAALKAQERIGDEAADTLLVYLFKERALIVDEYLRRILYRHFFIDSPKKSTQAIEQLLGPFVKTYDEAHKLHARINEVGELYCLAKEPNCGNCPFNRFEHRV